MQMFIGNLGHFTSIFFLSEKIHDLHFEFVSLPLPYQNSLLAYDELLTWGLFDPLPLQTCVKW